MKRTVILTIPEVAEGDDAPTHIEANHVIKTPEDDWITIDRSMHPVPPDDQLTRDLDEVTHALKKRTGLSPEREDMALFDACRRVRAAAGLDEGADDD